MLCAMLVIIYLGPCKAMPVTIVDSWGSVYLLRLDFDEASQDRSVSNMRTQAQIDSINQQVLSQQAQIEVRIE